MATLRTVRSTRRYFVFSVLLMLLALGMYGYLFYIVQSAEKEAAILENENTALAKREESIGDIRKSLAAVTDSRAALNSYIIESADIVPFLETIEKYGRDVGVATAIDNVALSEDKKTLTVNLSGEGDYEDVYRFIALLEAMPYEITIPTAEIQSQNASKSTAPASGSTQAVIQKNWGVKMALVVHSITASKE